jgi:hypothetical protein
MQEGILHTVMQLIQFWDDFATLIPFPDHKTWTILEEED